MMISRKLLSLLIGVAVFTPARSQAPQREEMKELMAHAGFYTAVNGRSAEVACFMRRAQRLAPGNPPLKTWYKEFGMDNKRVVVGHRLIQLWAKFKEDRDMQAAMKLTSEITGAVSNNQLVVAIKNTQVLTEVVKAGRGDRDLDYATALEIVGDLNALEHRHNDAAEAYARVLEIRRGNQPLLERFMGTARNADAYSREKDIHRIKSKLADEYWITDRDNLAAVDLLQKSGEHLLQ